MDVLGIEEQGENDQLDVLRDFKESVVKREDRRYEVSFPCIPGTMLSNTNETLSRKRFENVERKLLRNEKLREEYAGIVEEQLKEGVIEEAPQNPTGERVFYMPHKPVVKQSALTRVLNYTHWPTASMTACLLGPHYSHSLWDNGLMRMSTNLLLGDIEKAFLQISVEEEDRDSFRFLFNVKGEEKHLRFTRVPFRVEASPFLLGATLQHHFQQQGPEFSETVSALKENTYVDNLMQTAEDNDKLVRFKEESTVILESAKFPVHKWESNAKCLESESMPNPSKILGHTWNKEDDTPELPAKPFSHEQPVTKRTILSYLGPVNDPLGIISPTMAEGKHIYLKTCDEKKGWNTEVSTHLKNQWLKWTKQLKDVRIPRNVATSIGEMEASIYIFSQMQAF